MDSEKLKSIGFEFDKAYKHNQFITERFINGPLLYKITKDTETGEVTNDMVIDEVDCSEYSDEEVETLALILGSKNRG